MFIGENQKLLKTWVQEYAVPVEAPIVQAQIVQIINPELFMVEEVVHKFEPKEASIYSDSESIAEPKKIYPI
jgi:hypothetical protein